jgi:1,4-dihydroxy-2-naphthoate octaprenyltransferase
VPPARSSPLQTVVAFIALGRPLFLAGGFVMHALGVAAALYNGAPLNLTALLWGQIAITATQWMTHYANDYFDRAADRLNQTPTNWSGGSRVLLNDGVSPRAAHLAALLFACIALAAALVLTFTTPSGSAALPLILLALFLAWFYSAPPLRLHSRGVGELTTAIIVPGLTPLTGYVLQTGHLDLLPILAVLPLCCLQFCMLLAIEFPDAAGDQAAHKRTLVVRLGAERSARLYALVLLATYALLPLLVAAGLPPLAALAFLFSAPLALIQLDNVRRGAHRIPHFWNRFGFLSVTLLFLAALFEAIAFLLLLGI